MSAAENWDCEAEAIARYALRLGWDRKTFRSIVGSLPYADAQTERTMTGFALAAYRSAGVKLKVPHGRLSPTWKRAMEAMEAARPIVPDLVLDAAQWLQDQPVTVDPLAARVGRDKGPKGWDVVAALPPVPGATCGCGEPAVIRTIGTRIGHDRWRCPDCPPLPGEWGGAPRHPSPVNQGVDWSTTPVTCRCFTTVCLCGRRPPGD